MNKQFNFSPALSTYLDDCLDDCFERMSKGGFDGQYYKLMWFDERKHKVIRFYTFIACMLHQGPELPCEVRQHLFSYVICAKQVLQPTLQISWDTWDDNSNEWEDIWKEINNK